jgi:hypothetical protein
MWAKVLNKLIVLCDADEKSSLVSIGCWRSVPPKIKKRLARLMRDASKCSSGARAISASLKPPALDTGAIAATRLIPS